MVSEAEVEAAAYAITECMENDAWIPTMGVRREQLKVYIKTAARAALEAAEKTRDARAHQ